MEFDESLPSSSVFYPHSEQSSQLGLHTLQETSRHVGSKIEGREESYSPPPPPPPVGPQYTPEAPRRVISDMANSAPNSTHTNGATAVMKKPFLRKGSRKEPSALNKSPIQSNKPESLEKFDIDTRRLVTKSGNGFASNTQSVHSDPTNSQRKHLKQSSSPGIEYEDLFDNGSEHDDSGDVLLQGSDYWTLDRSTGMTQANRGVNNRNVDESNFVGNATLDVAKEFSERQSKAMRELDEFAALEEQVESMVDFGYSLRTGMQPISAQRNSQQDGPESIATSSSKLGSFTADVREYKESKWPQSESDTKRDYDDYYDDVYPHQATQKAATTTAAHHNVSRRSQYADSGRASTGGGSSPPIDNDASDDGGDVGYDGGCNEKEDIDDNEATTWNGRNTSSSPHNAAHFPVPGAGVGTDFTALRPSLSAPAHASDQQSISSSSRGYSHAFDLRRSHGKEGGDGAHADVSPMPGLARTTSLTAASPASRSASQLHNTVAVQSPSWGAVSRPGSNTSSGGGGSTSRSSFSTAKAAGEGGGRGGGGGGREGGGGRGGGGGGGGGHFFGEDYEYLSQLGFKRTEEDGRYDSDDSSLQSFVLKNGHPPGMQAHATDPPTSRPSGYRPYTRQPGMRSSGSTADGSWNDVDDSRDMKLVPGNTSSLSAMSVQATTNANTTTASRPLSAGKYSITGRSRDGEATTASATGIIRTRPPVATSGSLLSTGSSSSSSAAASAGQARTPSNARAGRSRSPVKSGKDGKGAGAKGANSRVSMDDDIAEKARELESELATYKQENTALKQLRKQQETALAEVLKERAEVLKWTADERKRTEEWCNEQKQAAVKERRTAAKLARDSRQRSLPEGTGSGVGSIRKEREEIMALQATIEKMKLDHEATSKKAKINERRLQQLVKEQSQKIDDSDRQVGELNRRLMSIWSFLDKVGVKIPASLAGTRPASMRAGALDLPPGAGEAWRRDAELRRRGVDSYVEEVDPGHTMVGSVQSTYSIADQDSPAAQILRHVSAAQAAQAAVAPAAVGVRGHSSHGDMYGGEDEQVPTGVLAAAIFGRSSGSNGMDRPSSAGSSRLTSTASSSGLSGTSRPTSASTSGRSQATAQPGRASSSGRSGLAATHRPQSSSGNGGGAGGCSGAGGAGDAGDTGGAGDAGLSSLHAATRSLRTPKSTPKAVGLGISPWGRDSHDADVLKGGGGTMRSVGQRGVLGVSGEVAASWARSSRSSRGSRYSYSSGEDDAERSDGGADADADTEIVEYTDPNYEGYASSYGRISKHAESSASTHSRSVDTNEGKERGRNFSLTGGDSRLQDVPEVTGYDNPWTLSTAAGVGSERLQQRSSASSTVDATARSRADVGAGGYHTSSRTPASSALTIDLMDLNMNMKSNSGMVNRDGAAVVSHAVPGAPSHGAAATSGAGAGAGASASASASASAKSEGSGGAARVEEVLADGCRVIRYRNGTHKEIFPDGRTFVRFLNGDTKESNPGSGIIVYFYAQVMNYSPQSLLRLYLMYFHEAYPPIPSQCPHIVKIIPFPAAQTTHTTFPDGLEEYRFPNLQIEKHYKDGRKEILFPDHTRKVIHTNGIQENFFPDGVVVREYSDGTREIEAPDGSVQRDVVASVSNVAVGR